MYSRKWVYPRDFLSILNRKNEYTDEKKSLYPFFTMAILGLKAEHNTREILYKQCTENGCPADRSNIKGL